MKINDLEKKITQDLAVELADEFDRNKKRKWKYSFSFISRKDKRVITLFRRICNPTQYFHSFFTNVQKTFK